PAACLVTATEIAELGGWRANRVESRALRVSVYAPVELLSLSMSNTQEITQAVHESSRWIQPLQTAMGRIVIGQKYLLDRLLLGLLANGHLLLEGVPGLA